MHVKNFRGMLNRVPKGVALDRYTKTRNFAGVGDKNVLKMYQKA